MTGAPWALAAALLLAGCATPSTVPWGGPVPLPFGECEPFPRVNATAEVQGDDAELREVQLFSRPVFLVQLSCPASDSPARLKTPPAGGAPSAEFLSVTNYSEARFQFADGRVLRLATALRLEANGTLTLALGEGGVPLGIAWNDAPQPLGWHEWHSGPKALASWDVETRLSLENTTREFPFEVNSTRNLGFHLDLGIPWTGGDSLLFQARLVDPEGRAKELLELRCGECGDQAYAAVDRVGTWRLVIATSGPEPLYPEPEAFHVAWAFQYAT